MASMTKEQAVETLREMYNDLPLIDRLGKRGEALTSAIVQLRRQTKMIDLKKQEELHEIRDILFNSNAIQCQDVAPEPVCDGMLSYYLYSYGMKIYVDFNKMAKALYEAGYRKGETDVHRERLYAESSPYHGE